MSNRPARCSEADINRALRAVAICQAAASGQYVPDILAHMPGDPQKNLLAANDARPTIIKMD